MTLLILGLILWSVLHYFRAIAPGARQSLTDKMGAASKGLVALGILASLVLMVIGYRSADFIPIWNPPGFFGHINNFLMLFAFYVYLQTATKPGTAYAMGNIKNPQLTGFKIWAFAHLLANGDLASIVLFGGLLAWAVGQVILSKRTVSLVDRDKASIDQPAVHLVLVAIAYMIVAGIHMALGVNPFGGV